MKNKLIAYLIKKLEENELPEVEPKKPRRPYGSVDVYVMGKWVGYISQNGSSTLALE